MASSGLARYIVRRLLHSVLLLLLISVLSFVIMRVAPGGPAQFAEDPRIGPEYREILRESFGLNDPLPIQYLK